MSYPTVNEKRSLGPTEEAASDEGNEVSTAANGNVLDGGLQRGLKNRHLVSVYRN